MSGNLERRYRRVLRLLPGWYRQQWEQDMVAAFLDSWLTGDPETDECVLEFCKPGWAETASVAGLAVRLHLGGPGTPRRYAWGQAIRRAVLAVLLVHAVLAVNVLVFLVWGRRLAGWLPAPPASLLTVSSGGVWDTAYYLAGVAWIAIFVTLALGHYRTARVLGPLAIVPGLVALLQAQLTGIMPAPFGPWIFWVLVDLAPVLAMTAFHSGAPRAAPWPWLLALPAPLSPRHGCLERTQDMPFQPPRRRLSVLASALAAGPRARRCRLRPHHPARAGPGASEPATGTRSGVTDHHASHAQPAPHSNRPVPGRLSRPLRVGAQRAAGRGSFVTPRAGRHREHGHPHPHADHASRAAGGRSVLPSGRNSGNDHFRSGLLGHHQPEPPGARLVRIRGRLPHRRCAGVDSAHPAGL